MSLNFTPCTEHVFMLRLGEAVSINGAQYTHIGSGMVAGYTDPEVARSLTDEPSREQDSATADA